MTMPGDPEEVLNAAFREAFGFDKRDASQDLALGFKLGFSRGYDHHRRTCDITNPRGWTSEQIREMERRSAELDKLIDRHEEAADHAG